MWFALAALASAQRFNADISANWLQTSENAALTESNSEGAELRFSADWQGIMGPFGSCYIPAFDYTLRPEIYYEPFSRSFIALSDLHDFVPAHVSFSTSGGRFGDFNDSFPRPTANNPPLTFSNYREIIAADPTAPIIFRWSAWHAPEPLLGRLTSFRFRVVDPAIPDYQNSHTVFVVWQSPARPGEEMRDVMVPAGTLTANTRYIASIDLFDQASGAKYHHYTEKMFTFSTTRVTSTKVEFTPRAAGDPTPTPSPTPRPTPKITLHQLTPEETENLDAGLNDYLIPVRQAARLASLPLVERGMVADGVTSLVLKVTLDGAANEGDVVHLQFDDWTGGAINPLHFRTAVLSGGSWRLGQSVPIDPVSATGFAVIFGIPSEALLVAPSSLSITAQLSANLGDSSSSRRIEFRKPPIFFVHGYRSNKQTWSASFLQSFQPKGLDAIPIDYAQQNNANATGTLWNLAKELDATLNEEVKSWTGGEMASRYALTRYDVVGHSQGGVLLRMLCLSPASRTYFDGQRAWKDRSNFNRGRFRRVVTLGSPHAGAIIATWLLSWERATLSQGKIAHFPSMLRRLNVLQDKFDVFGPEIKYINSPSFQVDPDAPFHVIATHIERGRPPSSVVTNNGYLVSGLQRDGVGTRLLPSGSDGVVEPESALGGKFSAADLSSTLWTVWNAQHADEYTSPSSPGRLFGEFQLYEQTKNFRLGEHIATLLDGDSSRFGRFVPKESGPNHQTFIDTYNFSSLWTEELLVRLVDGESSATAVGSSSETGDTYRFAFARKPDAVAGVSWIAEVYGPDGVTTDGVEITQDATDLGRVSLTVAPNVVGEIILTGSYTSAGGMLVVGGPLIVASRLPLTPQTGIEMRPAVAQLAPGSRVDLELWRRYADGTSIRAYHPADLSIFSSSNANVMTVSRSGQAVAKEAGSTTISAALDNHIASVAVTVGGPTPAPAAGADSVETHGADITIDALANDAAFDGGPLTLRGVTRPLHGSAVIRNGRVVYTPGASFKGVDQDYFFYQISDSQGTISTTTITVYKRNETPVAVDDIAVAQLHPISVAVLSNDTDADGDALTITHVQQPAVGAASLVGTDTVSFAPDGANDWDRAEIPYTIEDGYGGHSTASLIVYRSGADYDGDGQSNDAEIRAGTDPADGASILKIDTITREPSGIRLQWQSRRGVSYQVLWSDDLRSGSWNLSTPEMDGTGGIAEWIDDGSTTGSVPSRRFYRLSVP
jgi:hypothetical protein